MADPVTATTAQAIDGETLAALYPNLDNPAKIEAAMRIYMAAAPLRGALQGLPEVHRANLLRQCSSVITSALQAL